MPRLALLIAALLAAAPIARAQPPDPELKASAALNRTALEPGQSAAVAIVLDIPRGYHAQSAKPLDENSIPLVLTVAETPGVTFRGVAYPGGEVHNYKLLGKASVYTGRVILYVPLEVAATVTPGDLTLSGSVSYQMCDDAGVCLQPQSAPWTLKTQVVPAGQSKPASADLFKNYDPARATTAPATRPAANVAPPAALTGLPPAVNEYQVISADEFLSEPPQRWSYSTALYLALLAGLLFNIMPCVLPVLPLKAIGFYETAQHNRAKSIAFGAVFALGLISVFATLAIPLLAGWLTWGQQFSNPWFVWTIVAILVVMSLSLFGLFDVRVPTAIYSVTPRHDTYTGNFLFGILTAILATPCTAPLLPAVLVFALSLPKLAGALLIINVGVGMALPYFILSAFPGLARRFPRSGPWPGLFKQIMGFLVLATAVYFAAGRITTGQGGYFAIAAIGAAAAIYLFIRARKLSAGRPVPMTIATLFAAALAVGPAWLAIHMSGLFDKRESNFAWQPYTPATLQQQLTGQKPALVKFTASWCGTCQYIEATVFKDAAVAQALHQSGIAPIKVDFSRENPDGQLLLKTLSKTGGIPVTAIYAPDLKKVIHFDSVYNTDKLLKVLTRLQTPVARGT